MPEGDTRRRHKLSMLRNLTWILQRLQFYQMAKCFIN